MDHQKQLQPIRGIIKILRASQFLYNFGDYYNIKSFSHTCVCVTYVCICEVEKDGCDNFGSCEGKRGGMEILKMNML